MQNTAQKASKTPAKNLTKFVAIAALAVTALTGCASASQQIDLSNTTAVIDVRTPDEFANSHLQGAINIDVEGASWATEVETLDKAGNYVIYCHTGRRAGLAIDYMTQDGFTGTLTNAGGVDEAAHSTGLHIVTQ